MNECVNVNGGVSVGEKEQEVNLQKRAWQSPFGSSLV
jgi:hypothetical protein